MIKTCHFEVWQNKSFCPSPCQLLFSSLAYLGTLTLGIGMHCAIKEGGPLYSQLEPTRSNVHLQANAADAPSYFTGARPRATLARPGTRRPSTF
jgi:hypothetical protein